MERPASLVLLLFSAATLVAAGRLTAPQTDQHVAERRLVLAFYYPWYGTPAGPSKKWVHWDVHKRNYTHTPQLGLYDSRDPAVIRRHIAWARRAGIDGFICSWWGPHAQSDLAVTPLLTEAQRRNFRISIYLETFRDRRQALEHVCYVLKNYGRHPAFLKYRGRPVLFYYGRVMGQLSMDDFRWLFARLAEQGLQAVHIADGFREDYLRLFDGYHSYNPIHLSPARLAELYRSASQRAHELGKLFAATCYAGYDDRIIRKPGRCVAREDGKRLRRTFTAAANASPDWILLTSFNEWHEGSEFEPSVELGVKYLRLCGGLLKRWKSYPRGVKNSGHD